MTEYRSAPLTEANFMYNHIYITPFRDKLPVDVIGGSTKLEPANRLVSLEFSGELETTFVPTDKKSGKPKTFFEDRTLVGRLLRETGAEIGDTVLFTELAPLHFRLSLEKAGAVSGPGVILRRTASAEGYASFLSGAVSEPELGLLKTHALGGEMSMDELAPAIGYSGFRPVNAAYGKLGRRVAETLGLAPQMRANGTPIWFSVLAAWRDPRNTPERDDDTVSPQSASFRSYLHAEVIRGLHLARHLSDAELRDALQKCAAVADEASHVAGRMPEQDEAADPLDPQAALEHAIAVMIAMTRRTAAQSNGQSVERVVKNKELRISDEDLPALLDGLIEKQGGCCALTRLPLQYHGTQNDDQMLVSLDRKDSDGHYEADNVQVVCRFVNRWKSDMPDAEFRRLMAVVQTAGRE